MQKPKICLVLVGKLPLPAARGGAVETLAEHLLRENEARGALELTVLSVREERAVRQASAYPNTRFVWFGEYPLWNKFWWRVYALAKKLGKQELPFPYQRVRAAAWLKRHGGEFDYILAESELELIRDAKLPPEKVLYHMHWVGAPTRWRDACFGRLLAVSHFVARHWQAETGRPDAGVSVLPNCVDTAVFGARLPDEERAAVRQSLGFPEDCFVLLFCGRLVQAKGVRELLAALEKLPERVCLVLAGSTNYGLPVTEPYEREVRAMAERFGPRVAFTGFVQPEGMPRYYAVADAVVMPSQVEEGAPLVALEGMAAGRPVIATRSGGIPEYLNGDCGILVDREGDLPGALAAAVLRLQSDPALCRTMGEAGRAHAQQYGTAQYYQNFLDILKTL